MFVERMVSMRRSSLPDLEGCSIVSASWSPIDLAWFKQRTGAREKIVALEGSKNFKENLVFLLIKKH